MAYCNTGVSVFGDTTGAPARVASFGCGGRATPGGEVYYRLDSPMNGQITLRLRPHVADLDLFVLGANEDHGCDRILPCVASSQTDGLAVEQVVLPVLAGKTYYFVVDGVTAAGAGFTLDIDCLKR